MPNDDDDAALARLRSGMPKALDDVGPPAVVDARSPPSIMRATIEYLDAVDAVDREYERSLQPGANAQSSAPVVRMIQKLAKLRRAVEQEQGAVRAETTMPERACVRCPACGTGVLHVAPSDADVQRIDAISALASVVNGAPVTEDHARMVLDVALHLAREAARNASA